MSSATLNDDILGIIAGLLTAASLVVVANLHRVFFEEQMRRRYRALTISAMDKQTKRTLLHVLETPRVAKLIRTVYVKPWLIQLRPKSYQSQTKNAFDHLAAFFDPQSVRRQAELRLSKRLEKDIHRVQTTLARLTNVEDYTVEWDGSTKYQPELFHEFLIPILTCWRTHLCSLSLHLPTHIYATFAQVKLPRLETISVTFDTGTLDPSIINSHLDAWLVFLHNLRDTLRCLTIKSTPSSEGLDLSRLFRYMCTFPHLRSITLSIPFDGGHLSTIRPFSKFLANHSDTLESLALQTTRCSPHTGKPVEVEWQYWIQGILQDLETPLPKLESVSLALRPLKAPLGILHRFLEVHMKTIRTLALTDRTLSPEEIMTICGILSPASSLGRVDLQIDPLSPQLFHNLANAAPTLHTLKLSFPEGSRNACNLNPALFHNALKGGHIDVSRWPLRRLIVPKEFALEAVVVECIPSIESVEESISL